MTMFKSVFCILLAFVAQGAHGAHFQGGAFSWKPLNIPKLGEDRGIPIEVSYNVGYFGFRTSNSPSEDKPTKHQTCTQDRINAEQVLTTKGYIKCHGECSRESELQRWIDMTWICTDYSEMGDWDIGGKTWVEWVPEGTTSMVVYHESCCWVGPLENIEKRDNVGYMMMTEIDVTPRKDNGRINSSPVTSVIPVQQFHQNCHNWLEIPVYDPDGDSYRCRWKELYTKECYKDEWEMCGPINKVQLFDNCTILFNSYGEPGWYGAAVTIEDLDANGEPLSRITLSFLINVTADDTTCKTPVIIEPKTRCKTIPVNQPHQITVIAEAATEDLPIARIDIIKPHEMTVSELQDVEGHPLRKSVTLSWTPTSSDRSKVNKLSMNAVDSKGFVSGWSHMILNVAGESELLFPVQSQSLPTEGQEVDNTYEWHVAFNRQITRPYYPAYISIMDSNGGLIDKLDASDRQKVQFRDRSVVFNVTINGDISFVSNAYTIIIDEGVAVNIGEGTGGDDCPMKSVPDEWSFDWKGIKPATPVTPTLKPAPPPHKCIPGEVNIEPPPNAKDGDECFIVPGQTTFDITGSTINVPYNLCCPSSCQPAPPGPPGPPGAPPGIVIPTDPEGLVTPTDPEGLVTLTDPEGLVTPTDCHHG